MIAPSRYPELYPRTAIPHTRETPREGKPSTFPTGCVFDLHPPHRDTNLQAARESLRAYHDVFNEQRYLRKQLQAGLPPQDAWRLPYAQALGLITEFGLRFGNEVTYNIRNDQMIAPGHTVPTAEALASHASCKGARESADAVGFMRIEQALLQGREGTVVVQISPPSIARNGEFARGYGAYGFLNIFTREGEDVVTARHIMYSEDTSLSQSLRLHEILKLSPEGDRPTRAEEYIQNPHLISQPHRTEAEIMKALGLGDEWREYLNDRTFFKRNILEDILVRDWLLEYARLQVSGAQEKSNASVYALHAEQALIAAYNRAKKIYSSRERSSETAVSIYKRQPTQHEGSQREQLAWYASLPFNIAPGSCPVGGRLQDTLTTQGFITHRNIVESFLGGGADVYGGRWVKRDCVKCPCDGCGFVSTKAQPHLYDAIRERWVCANPHCKEHNQDIYKRVVNRVL